MEYRIPPVCNISLVDFYVSADEGAAFVSDNVVSTQQEEDDATRELQVTRCGEHTCIATLGGVASYAGGKYQHKFKISYTANEAELQTLNDTGTFLIDAAFISKFALAVQDDGIQVDASIPLSLISQIYDIRVDFYSHYPAAFGCLNETIVQAALDLSTPDCPLTVVGTPRFLPPVSLPPSPAPTGNCAYDGKCGPLNGDAKCFVGYCCNTRLNLCATLDSTQCQNEPFYDEYSDAPECVLDDSPAPGTRPGARNLDTAITAGKVGGTVLGVGVFVWHQAGNLLLMGGRIRHGTGTLWERLTGHTRARTQRIRTRNMIMRQRQASRRRFDRMVRRANPGLG